MSLIDILNTRTALIEQRHWAGWCDIISSVAVTDDVAAARTTDVFGSPIPQIEQYGSVAVVPVRGPLLAGFPQRIAEMLGITTPQQIEEWIDVAEASDAETLLLDVDSPGGIVTGIPELADRISEARGSMRVVAWTSGMMCSAAYWLGSQANAVYASPSSDVGSIGVYTVHYDTSALMARIGIKTEVFKSGDLKAAGVDGTPLTDDQRADIQAGVDEIGVDFRAAVKKCRKNAKDEAMRGQSFSGRTASRMGLVNGLRRSRNDLIADLLLTK